MSGTRLVLVRHGESVVTARRIVGGPRSCVGLTDLGRRQAGRLAERLASPGEVRPDAVVSSAYPRARETAEIVSPAVGIESVDVRPGFGEHDPGPDCDGLTYDEFVRRFGMPDWGGHPDAVLYPGGETVRQFHERVYTALDAALRDYAGATILLSCHGGVIDAILRRGLGSPSTGGFEIRTRNCSLTELLEVRGGHWALLRYNDHGHLRGLPDASPAA